MKRTSIACRLLLGLLIGSVATLLAVSVLAEEIRAIKPVRVEVKTAQNETVSYIYAESHALVIGVSQYRNGWSNLPGVRKDVKEVSQALQENGFQVTTIEDPGLDQLEIAIEDFIFEKGVNPENRLLIYYAGHGHTMTLGYGGEMGFLVPADAPVPKKGRDAQFRRQALSMQRIEEVAKNTSAKHVLFMFDACFAGSVFLVTRVAPAYIQQNTKEPVRQFITSGSAEQEVPDKSIFRRAFVDALNGKADYDKDGYLTGTELGSYIQKRTAEDWEGKLTPQYGKLQDPNLNKGDFVFELSKPLKEKRPKAQPNLATQAWAMIEQSENPAIFQAFIEKFPDAPQRQLAELKLMLLSSDGIPAKPDTSSPEKVKPTKLSSNLASPANESDSSINLVSGANERYRWTPVIVEDKQAKLIWQRQDNGERTFEWAKSYCEGLRVGGDMNWRLPEIDELRELPVESESRSDGTSELFNELRRGSYWSGALLNNARVRFQNPWDDKGGIAARYGKDARYTLCVRSSDGSTPKSSSTVNLHSSNNSSSKTKKNEIQSSFQKRIENSSYQKIAESTSKVIGCGFFHVGCLEEPLKFPPYQPNFHLKDYRRVHLWGKDRPWTDTELRVQNGDRVYFYGTGEVTTCPHSSCNGRGPRDLNQGSLSCKIGEEASPKNLNRFTKIQSGSGGFKSWLQTRSNGALYLSVRDWNTYPPPSNYYDDNSGVYILDIFVIDPDQEEGFNRFKDALFKANPEDSSARAYLGN